uniref:Uncharacterized protein n=1 Tax=Octopus bimaculoides TaxID=37653 RepID=A0A0L8G5T2_OCTBM
MEKRNRPKKHRTIDMYAVQASYAEICRQEQIRELGGTNKWKETLGEFADFSNRKRLVSELQEESRVFKSLDYSLNHTNTGRYVGLRLYLKTLLQRATQWD